MRSLNFMKRVKTSVAVSAVSLAVVLAPPLKADNLADALIGAYNTSGLLEQNRALLRIADEDAALALSRLRPILDFALTATRSYSDPSVSNASNTSTLNAQFSASWLLWDGGELRLSLQATKEVVLATRQTLISVEQTILLRAVSAYVNVLLQEENVALRRNNLRLLGEELRAAQDRFEVGEVTRTDVALAESRVAAARSNLADSQGDLITARAEYTSAVGREPGRLAGQPRLPARAASISAATAVAVRRHPDILAAQHQVAAAELRIMAAQKGLGPSLSATARLGATDNLDISSYSETGSLSLSLTQRIYQGGGLAAAVRRAMGDRDQRRSLLLTAQRNVRQDVSDAYTRLQVAVASLAARAEQVRAAQVAFDGIREEATLGARTTLDVLSAEQELLNALTSQVSARSEQSIAAFQLLSTQGLLTAEQLGLAVQIYDPTLYYNLAKDAPSARSKQAKDLDRVLKALGKK
ncbi:MAG: TolC family outer membrane protein [Sedimentitalea sp.]